MQIAFDITPLGLEHLYRGIGRYTQQLKDALLKYDRKNKYTFFSSPEPIPENVDLVHYPYFDIFFHTLPITHKIPRVVTVHDLIPLQFPEHFPRGFKGELRWLQQKIALSRTELVITVSEFSKKEIIKMTRIPELKIKVIYEAQSPIFQKISDPKILSQIKNKYHLPDKFILYVGDVNWNKNLENLIKAFKLVKNKVKLVLIGKAFLDETLAETKSLNQIINDLTVADKVMKLGFVPDADLAMIYSMADVYIQPSIAEGFGLPVLEALACGTPVISSKLSSLPEIAGPATLVDPYDIDAITRETEILLNLSDDKKRTLRQKGISWAAKFNWEKVANNYIKAYESVLNK